MVKENKLIKTFNKKVKEVDLNFPSDLTVDLGIFEKHLTFPVISDVMFSQSGEYIGAMASVIATLCEKDAPE